MKKVISFLLTVVMVVSTISAAAISVSATTAPVIGFSDTEVYPGDTVKIGLDISGNTGCAYLYGQMLFDNSVFKLVSAENGNIADEGVVNIDPTSSLNLMTWKYGKADTDKNGTIAYFTFKVDEEAALDDYDFGFSIINFLKYDESPIAATTQTATVTVKEKKLEPAPLSDFEFTRNGNELTITKYNGSASELVIGSTYEIEGTPCTVVALDNPEEGPFEANENLTSVIIPDSVKVIGDYAFYDCINLLKVTVEGKDVTFGECSLGWYYIDRKTDGITDNLTVYGFKNSTAETYTADLTAENETVTFVCIPEISGANLSLKTDVSLNVYIDENSFGDGKYKKPYVVFYVDGKQFEVKDMEEYSDPKTSKKFFRFALPNVAPDRIGDNTEAEIHALYNGADVVCGTKEYSIKDYCYTQLDKLDTKEAENGLGVVLVDLLNFGAEAQKATKHDLANLVNENLGEKAAWATEGRTLNDHFIKEAEKVDTPTAVFYGANLNLNKSVAIQFYVTTKENLDGLSLSVKNLETGVETVYDSTDFTVYEGQEDTYLIKYDALNPTQMSDRIQAKVMKNGVAISNTLQYSIESYAFNKQNEKIGPLVKAMMKYGDSSRKCFGVK